MSKKIKVYAITAGIIAVFGYGIHLDRQTITCRQEYDISITGSDGIWEKCSSKYGSYYTERMIVRFN